jgi:signal transduction histidine kinase
MVVDASVAPARGVSGVDVVRVGLIAIVGTLLLVTVAFVGHRITAPADGTRIVALATVSVGSPEATVQAEGSGSGQIQAGDRIEALLGRDVADWADLLLDPGALRPSADLGDPIQMVVAREGRTVSLTTSATAFDPLRTIASSWGFLALGLALMASGAYAVVHRPDEPSAQAVLVGGTALLASAVGWTLGLQALDLVTATGFWLYAATAGVAYALFLGGVLQFALVFPRPHPLIAERRSIGAAWLAPLVGLLALSIAVGLLTGRVLAALDAWRIASAVLQVAVVGVAAGLLAASYRRSVDPVGRLQLRWLAGAIALAAVGAVALWLAPLLILGEALVSGSAMPLLLLPIPVALAVAISGRFLFDLDTIVNRSVVYGGLTAGVILTYALAVALVGRFIPGNAPFAVALLAAGAVAVVALPLHDRLQRWVNRLMFGDRDDPDRALRRLGQRLETSLDPQTVLPTLVEAVADAMRSPYVAIELDGEGALGPGEPKVEAAAGRRPIDASGPRDVVRLPIVYRGRPVGHLALCPRGPGEAFGAADERLLADLARQAAPAVEAVRLTVDLRRSREALVTAREEERRRLRRDLHDELGPALAGSMMKVAAARSLLASDPARASGLLDDLATDSRGIFDEIRRIAYNLRPPALDEVGLTGALRQHVASFDESGPAGRVVHATLEAPDRLPPLPAAVEVAALRIAVEGLTNAARHSGGSSVCVRLGITGDSLEINVSDDGRGVAPGVPAGIGVTSMRERAEELGGTFRLDTNEAGGTSVVALLPLGHRSTP